jgi:hypothetical protein
MRLAALSSAVAVGCSLEPFRSASATIHVDGASRTHLNPDCDQLDGDARRSTVSVGELHLHMRCGTCASHLPVDIAHERYAEACEALDRVRALIAEAAGLDGVDALRTAARALSFDADAAAEVTGAGEATTVEVERAGARLRARAWAIIETHRDAGRGLVHWAVSFALDDPEASSGGQRRRREFEHARRALRDGDEAPLAAVLHADHFDTYKTQLNATATAGPWVLCELTPTTGDGFLVAALSLQHRVHRHGRLFGVVPAWAARCADALALPIEFAGEVALDERCASQVELFSELARRLPKDRAAVAATRLGRIRPVAFTWWDVDANERAANGCA